MTAAPGRARQVVLVAMILANSIILVDQPAVPLALPSILSQFGVATQAVEWVLNASLLALSGFLIPGGRLGDQFGRRRVFLIGAIAFAAGSTLGGLAPAFPVLVGARVVQGLGGALMLPGSVAIVSATFPAHERGKALGTMGGVSAIAGALGPTIGGALTSAVSWRLVLLVNVPLAAACVVATLSAVPRDRAKHAGVHVDLGGVALARAAQMLGPGVAAAAAVCGAVVVDGGTSSGGNTVPPTRSWTSASFAARRITSGPRSARDSPGWWRWGLASSSRCCSSST